MGAQDDIAHGRPDRSGRIQERSHPAWRLVLATLLGIAWIGCSDRESAPTQPDEPPSRPNLEAPLGGLSATDEEPAFGEPAIAQLVEAEIEFHDPISEDPAFVSIAQDPAVRAFAVSLLWGRLDRGAAGGPREDGDVDWSGRLRISRGAILLERVVGFETSDLVSNVGLDARELRWTSRAGPRHDGLRVSIWNRSSVSADSVYLEAGSYSGAWSVEELASLDLTSAVAGTAHQIAIRGMPISGDVREGFVQGYWRKANGEPAEFAGRWMGARGEVLGFVRGIYGTTDAGARVLFGKWIDREGAFQGFLRGSWELAPDASLRVAGFEADLLVPVEASDQVRRIGRCTGRWRISSGQGEGGFEARWCLDC